LPDRPVWRPVDVAADGPRGRHRTGALPIQRAGGWRKLRTSGPSRRAVTIAAVTTGTIAVSTAAFGAVGPGDPGGAPDTASLFGGTTSSGTSGPDLLAIAQQVANTQPADTELSITPDSSRVLPANPVLLTVRATAQGGSEVLANTAVRVMVANGPRWATTAILHTDSRGYASITAHLLTTTKVTVAFDGTGALRPAVAAATTISVYTPTPAGGATATTVDPGILNAPTSSFGSKAVYLASLQKGKPYVWGAAGPYSFDCSGLVQYVYRQLGRYLPRTAESQYEATTHIARSAKQPGDLIFFGAPGSIYHVAIYAGNGYIWQAPQTGETVQLVPIWSSSYTVGRVL
jgi:peptidoglycan DL-endopeptidase CwlO